MANELIKYKVSDLARDLGLPAKQVIDELAAATGETKKPGANLNKDELNLLMDRLTRTAQEDSLAAYLDTAPKPQPKPSEVLRRADGSVVELRQGKKKQAPQPEKKAEPAPKADKKPEAAKPAPKAEKKPEAPKAAPAPQPVEIKREQVTITVDTRTSDTNLDKYNERYTEMAAAKPMDSRRKPTPAGNKQKFQQKGKK
ncbi:MAG: translation initiation factor IF-2 N-terminal domain-containing protein, partial [Oscillospiraceae bacterium]|nr:translation initiation factor IF-2 N-terminal domain-containing protein [Oscillospiraceae bacterium]